MAPIRRRLARLRRDQERIGKVELPPTVLVRYMAGPAHLAR